VPLQRVIVSLSATETGGGGGSSGGEGWGHSAQLAANCVLTTARGIIAYSVIG